LSIIALTGDLI